MSFLTRIFSSLLATFGQSSTGESTSSSPVFYPDIIPSPERLTELRRVFGAPGEPTPTKRIINRATFAIEIDGVKRCVKWGRSVLAKEAIAMEYVRRNTTIPVPKVHWFWKDEAEGRGYIVMDFIESDWRYERAAARMPAEQQTRVAAQLADYVQQLRDLGGSGTRSMGSWQPENPQEPMAYQNVYYRPREQSLWNPGPFQTLKELKEHWFLRWQARPELGDPPQIEMDDVSDRVVLTHGDLSGRNILVKDGSIVAVLDWDTFGWYPAFWEYYFIATGTFYPIAQDALAAVFDPLTKPEYKFACWIDEAFAERG